MFELYTEKARRVIFFSRYEASQFGSPHIETEHLLLGLVREDKALTNRFFRSHASVASIRKQIEEQTTIREASSISVDLPLSSESRRVLAYAAEEMERLAHKHLGTEHLLLGLLREEGGLAARLLSERGISLEETRAKIAAAATPAPERPAAESSGTGLGLATGFAGLRARITTPPSPPIRFVNEAGEHLAAASNLPIYPRIGESITLPNDGSPRSYRVVDVVWTFAQSGAEHILTEIVIQLAAQG